MALVNRRGFFKSMLGESLAWVDSWRGKPHFRIDDLKSAPDEKIRNLVPVFNRARPSFVSDGCLRVQTAKAEDFRPFDQLTKQEEYILHRFDGDHSLSGIADCLAAEYEMDAADAFSQVKHLFFHLSEAGLCHPAGAPR